MFQSRIDISEDLDGQPVVLACFDLGETQTAASAHAVAATIGERFRTSQMSADEVLEFRELTALADDLAERAARPGIQTLVMMPARLSAYRQALASFVEARDYADWLRDGDREPLAQARALLMPLEELSEAAMRAALEPVARPY